MGGVEGGSGAVAEAGDIWLEAAGPDDFGGLIGGGGNQAQPGRDAGFLAGPRGYFSQGVGGRDQVWQNGGGHGHSLPLPIPGRSPAQFLVIERDVSHLAANRIDETAAH